MADSIPKQHIYGIDFLRLVAAVSVSVFHFTWCTKAAGTLPIGWLGVEVFFVISGFVIAQSADRTTPAAFIKSRLLRLYPAAWIAVVLNATALLVVPHAFYDAAGFSTQFSLSRLASSAILFSLPALASSYWTLPIEIAFYALIALLLLRFGRPHLRLVAIVLTAVSAPYLTGLYLHHLHVVSLPFLDFHYGLKNISLLRHGPYFALGILFWLAKNRSAFRPVDIFAWSLALILPVLEISARVFELERVFAAVLSPSALLFYALTSFYALLALIAVAVFYSDRMDIKPGPAALIRTAGLATYPYYLLHECCGGALLYLFSGLPMAAKVTASVLVLLAVTLGIARWVEPLVRRPLRTQLDRHFPAT